MSGPSFEYTDELHEVLDDFNQQRTDLFVAGADPEAIGEFVAVIRRVDAELVAARHAYRAREFSPHFPEGFQAEEDGLEDAERLLRGSMPEKQERVTPVTHVSPSDGSGLTACCRRAPSEIARADCITQDPDQGNCAGTEDV